jgi:uncharacterized membrane protein YbhN (UPF0104 family)
MRVTAMTKKRLWLAVKISICAAAVWYLSGQVTVYDYIRLRAEPGVKYRLLAEIDGHYEIRPAPDATIRRVSPDALADEMTLKPGQRPLELGLLSIGRSVKINWALGALSAFSPVPFILAWRIRYLLAMQDIAVGYRDALWLTFAGNFFNFSLPGTTGGDVYKAYHFAKRTPKRVEAVTVIILDRVVGLVSFLLLSALALLLCRNPSLAGDFGDYVLYLVAAFFLVAGLFFSDRVRRAVRFEAMLGRLPFGENIRRVDETALRCIRRPLASLNVLGATVVSHAFNVTNVYCLARGFGIDPLAGEAQTDFYLVVTLATVVGYLFAAIPISIQGFGLMEAVYWQVLVVGGWATASQMLALTLATRLVQIVWALPGIAVPFLGFETPPAEAADHAMDLPSARDEAPREASTI